MIAAARVIRTLAALGLVAAGISDFALAVEATTSPGVEHLSASRKTHVVAGASYVDMAVKESRLRGPALRVGVDLFPGRNFAVEVAYFSMNSSQGTTLISGTEVSGKWYPFAPGTDNVVTGSNFSLQSHASWAAYGLVGYRVRTFFQDDAQLPVSGFGLGAGLDWHLGRTFSTAWVRPVIVSGEVTADRLHTSSNTALKMTTVTLGGGVAL